MSSQTNQNKLRALCAQLELRGCDLDCAPALIGMLKDFECRINKLEQILERREKGKKRR